MQRIFKDLIDKVIAPIKAIREANAWRKRGYLDFAPQFIKQRVFLKYGLATAPWVETGTYLGTTTRFLERHFPKVITIEPSETLANRAKHIFRNSRVEVLNDVSESAFPKLLPQLSGGINFWLDGHYSAGVTFKGEKDCPVIDELASIGNNLSRFEKVNILIDDVRCFLGDDPMYSDYPSLEYLVEWARNNGFKWRIEQDIFIMRNYTW